jgi:hypothetical protein
MGNQAHAQFRPKPTDDVMCQVPKCIRVHGAYRMPMLTPDCVLLRGGLALRRGFCLRPTARVTTARSSGRLRRS